MLIVIILNVTYNPFVLSVIMLSVVRLSAVAPIERRTKFGHTSVSYHSVNQAPITCQYVHYPNYNFNNLLLLLFC
jgi:hypothetical protein